MFRYAHHKCTSSIAASPTFPASHFVKYTKKNGCVEDVPSYACREPLAPRPLAPSQPDVRVVSFNVLSCMVPSGFAHVTPLGDVNVAMSPEHEPQRWAQVLRILELYMQGDYVVCLQEVTTQTRADAALHGLLDQYGYTQVMTNYGWFNQGKTTYAGFLGVAVLVPPCLELVDYKVPQYTREPRFEDRRMAVAVLKDSKGRVFGAASVHVPCKHGNPALMSKFVVDIASTMESECPDMPYFIGGDWNMNHWDCAELGPFGLKKAHQSSADRFTCSSCKLDDDHKPVRKFYLLDYIVHKKFRSVEAADLSAVPDDQGFFIPNAGFPSDHLPIEATFRLGDPEGQSCLEALTGRLWSA